MRKVISVLTAVALAVAVLAPGSAEAQRRGYHNDRSYEHYDHRRGYYRDHDNDGDAVAAGVVGLVLGLAIGSLASQDRRYREAPCYDNYQRCAPPQGYYAPGYSNQGYYDQGYQGQGYRGQGYQGQGYYDPRYGGLEGGYDPRYDQRGYAPPPQCTRRERQWDRYAQRYVLVDVPC